MSRIWNTIVFLWNWWSKLGKTTFKTLNVFPHLYKGCCTNYKLSKSAKFPEMSNLCHSITFKVMKITFPEKYIFAYIYFNDFLNVVWHFSWPLLQWIFISLNWSFGFFCEILKINIDYFLLTFFLRASHEY